MVHYWAGNAERFLADDHPKPHNLLSAARKLTTVYPPYPVVGVITPWNVPFTMAAMDVAPALAAGAAVLLKPSEVTPLSAVEFVRGWTEVGAPPVLALATGYGETGAAAIANLDFVQFTGSAATGRKIALQCAERLIPYSLECGGKDQVSLAQNRRQLSRFRHDRLLHRDGAVIIGQMQQHYEPCGALHQRADRRLHSFPPTIRSLSQCPGTARSSTSAGRSLMLTMSAIRLPRRSARRCGLRSARPVRRHWCSSRCNFLYALHVDRLVDGFVGHPHLHLVGKIQRAAAERSASGLCFSV